MARELIGEPADFLADGMTCKVTMYEGTALSVELPQTVTLEVVEADPVVQGPDRVVVVQAGQARKRPPGADPAAYRSRHPHRRQHRRRQLHGTRQGLIPLHPVSPGLAGVQGGRRALPDSRSRIAGSRGDRQRMG